MRKCELPGTDVVSALDVAKSAWHHVYALLHEQAGGAGVCAGLCGCNAKALCA